MGSLRRIVAATDLSAPACHAAERAALVSREIAAPLDLLHVANLLPLDRLRQLMGATPIDLEQRVLEAARHKPRPEVSACVLRLSDTATPQGRTPASWGAWRPALECHHASGPESVNRS